MSVDLWLMKPPNHRLVFYWWTGIWGVQPQRAQSSLQDLSGFILQVRYLINYICIDRFTDQADHFLTDWLMCVLSQGSVVVNSDLWFNQLVEVKEAETQLKVGLRKAGDRILMIDTDSIHITGDTTRSQIMVSLETMVVHRWHEVRGVLVFSRKNVSVVYILWVGNYSIRVYDMFELTCM